MIRSSPRSIVPLFTLLAFALAGCSSDDEPKLADPHTPPTYMLYSPNGEPLNGGPLGKPTCDEALSKWFAGLSSADTGRISKDAFMRDARAQFVRMDIDHNGYIVSEELDRYREPYRQQPARKAEAKDDDKEVHGKHGHKGKDGGADQTDLSFTTADPVMSADTNLDFKVSQEEFLHQAEDIFTKLDTNHNGMLGSEEVLAQCKKK